ncbi:Bcr/CflA family efflux MFS transporter [Paractinoplanes lichenicola]|uniref:Bcr/CflA family efflux MFS transporter n=1 Tax=Paractinoplanes lichenicola TaxID=2802976 RepID=A0ABS1VG19_9ACTN|nr:Bcr/CflA family efflux MFS transporter [Actinoplanes lichenicola]MBL7252702.1 Bcr/CflA family efflux MFS transporter [Actinoplanes lichenicola]
MISSLLAPRTAQPRLAALLLVTGTAALSTDTYIAALPSMQASLQTSASVVQLTLTFFIAGMAVGQLLSGPVSDARGRRAIVLGACVVFTIMSILCAIAPTGGLLVAVRAVQGAAAGVATAVGRAVVTDIYRGREAAALFGTLSAVGLLAPVLAPAIGGVLLTFGDWRVVFWFLTLVGVAMTVAATVALPESLPPERRHPGGLANLLRRSRDLLTDPHFAVPVLVQCLTVAGFFVYIGGSSFVLQEDLGLSAREYTMLFTVNALTMVTTSVIFRLLVKRTGAVVLRRCAVVLQTAAVLVLFLITLLAAGHRPPLTVVWTALALMTAGLGLYFPSNAAIAQNAGRRFSGTASALSGGLPFLTGALTTPLTGALGSQTVMTMALCMATGFLLAAVVAALGRRYTVEPVD